MQSPVEKAELLYYYGRRFQKVRVDRSRGVAPHKPILLLSVIESIQNRDIAENKIRLTPQLIRVFLKYWFFLGAAGYNPDISKPFFYMKSGKFWHLWPKPGFEKVLSSKRQLGTYAEVKRAVDYAYVDEDLFELLQEPDYSESLGRAVTGRWFPGRWNLVQQISSTRLLTGETLQAVKEYSRFYGRLELGDNF